MKTRVRNLLAAALLLPALNIPFTSVRAQGTAFTYQGLLNSGGGPAGGSYDLTFTLYDSTNLPGNVIAGPLTNSATGVTNGLFTTTLDFGAGVFTGNARWLEIAVRTNGGSGFATLSPRQQITPTPYAIMAGSASNLLGTLPSAQLSGIYGGPVTFNNGLDNFDGTFFGQFFGSTFTGGSFSGQFLGDGSGLSGLWRTAGNSGTTPGVNFLGTTDNQPLIIKVNGQEAERFEPNTNAPNVIGGYSGNSDSGAQDYGVTIGGGGASGIPNSIQGANATFATIGGGADNTISGNNVYHSVISGGSYNSIAAYQSVIAGGSANAIQGSDSAIGGGLQNTIQSNTEFSVIAGGIQNTIQSNNFASYIGAGNNNVISAGAGGSIIGGGNASIIGTNADHSIIAAGWQNTIEYWAYESAISGGEFNDIGPYSQWTFIGEGINNTNDSSYAFIGGGYDNLIQFNNWGAFIGSGAQNTIQTGSGYSAIASGFLNIISSNSSYAVISGGNGNLIQSDAAYSSIDGGTQNRIETNAGYSFIGGGLGNVIQTNAWVSVIVGGEANTLGTNATWSTIGGGYLNEIDGWTNPVFYIYGSSIVGGIYNHIYSFDYYSLIGGGSFNSIQAGSQFGVIVGGTGNVIQTNSLQSFIGGGNNNHIQGNDFHAVISGGALNNIQDNANDSMIAGGYNNSIQAGAYNGVIGGGYNNSIQSGAFYSTIDGGVSNVVGRAGGTVSGGNGNAANGVDSFAAGTFSQATNDGSFVLSDQEYTNFYSTASNQLSARFTGGIVFVTAGAGMTLDGLPIFAGNNGAGLVNINASTLNGLASTAFAPASGSANYIQNQNGSPQAASFNITGGGQFGGAVSATTLVVSNIIASGPVTAPTVAANGLTGGTVSATTLAAANSLIVTNNAAIAGTVAANSLVITNSFRVSGAGINTGTAAFIQLSAATNTSGDNTVIYNPLSDGDPNAILVVTHNYNPGMAFNTIYNKTVGVYYNGAHWAIYNEDLSSMPTNIAFNVLVIKH